jgi:hypothetical protein
MEKFTEAQREVLSMALTDLHRKVDRLGMFGYLTEFGAETSPEQVKALNEALQQLLNTEPGRFVIAQP